MNRQPGDRSREAAEDVLRGVIRKEYRRVVAAMTALAGDRVVAEEAVQDALVRLWIRLERGDTFKSPSAWVARVARNEVLSAFRRRGVERRLRSLVAPAERDCEQPRAPSEVLRALAGLSRRQREVLVLQYYLGFTTGEISATLGVAQGTVKATALHGRKALVAALGGPERALEVLR